MIDDLLDIYRHEAGRFRIVRSQVDLHKIVHAAIGMVRALADERRVSFDLEMAPEIPALTRDEPRLIRCLINLLENAIRYCPVGKKVRIEAAREGNIVRVSVENPGKGISPENFP